MVDFIEKEVGEDEKKDSSETRNCNLDPTKYRILKEKRLNDCTILKLAYIIDSDNQNTKILLFKGCSLLDIVQQKDGIHPEFYEDSKIINPVAIFKPDDEGWRMAEHLAETFK